MPEQIRGGVALPKASKAVPVFGLTLLLLLSVGYSTLNSREVSATGQGDGIRPGLSVATPAYHQQQGDATALSCCPPLIAAEGPDSAVSASRSRALLLGAWLTPAATGTLVATSTATPTPTRALPPPPVLMQRLTRDRPGIWGSVGMYFALGTTYVILIGLFLAHLVKVREGGDGDLTE